MLAIINQYQIFFVWIIASFSLFFIGIISIPYLIRIIPEDYFLNDKQSRYSNWPLKIIINILGWMLLFFGLIMLLTPGPGIITILLALFLIDFPKKRWIEKKLIANDKIFTALNWLRCRYRCPPIKRK